MTADTILRSFEFYRLATPQRRGKYFAVGAVVSLPEGSCVRHVPAHRVRHRHASLLVLPRFIDQLSSLTPITDPS